MAEFDFEGMLNLIQSLADAPSLKAILIVIGIVVSCVLYITKYYYDKNKREKFLLEQDQNIKKEQTEVAHRLQMDISEAIIRSLDVAYQMDFDFYKKKIEKEDYVSVFLKLPSDYREEVKTFLYDKSLTAEHRSALIINQLKGGSK